MENYSEKIIQLRKPGSKWQLALILLFYPAYLLLNKLLPLADTIFILGIFGSIYLFIIYEFLRKRTFILGKDYLKFSTFRKVNRCYSRQDIGFVLESFYAKNIHLKIGFKNGDSFTISTHLIERSAFQDISDWLKANFHFEKDLAIKSVNNHLKKQAKQGMLFIFPVLLVINLPNIFKFENLLFLNLLFIAIILFISFGVFFHLKKEVLTPTSINRQKRQGKLEIGLIKRIYVRDLILIIIALMLIFFTKGFPVNSERIYFLSISCGLVLGIILLKLYVKKLNRLFRYQFIGIIFSHNLNTSIISCLLVLFLNSFFESSSKTYTSTLMASESNSRITNSKCFKFKLHTNDIFEKRWMCEDSDTKIKTGDKISYTYYEGYLKIPYLDQISPNPQSRQK